MRAAPDSESAARAAATPSTSVHEGSCSIDVNTPSAASRPLAPAIVIGRKRPFSVSRAILCLGPVLLGLLVLGANSMERLRLDSTSLTEQEALASLPPPEHPVLVQPPELTLGAGGASSQGASMGSTAQPLRTTTPMGWEIWMRGLEDPNSPRYVIVDAKNGLGNRLRALCSAMSVAASMRRPVLLIWHADLHCNCSFASLFRSPLPFALLEEEIPRTNLSSTHFQVYNYMRPEPGAVKDEEVFTDPRRHLYFKSGFVMNHYRGQWKFAQRYLQPPFFPQPVDAVAKRLVTDRSMVGLHVRNVFDAPRDAASANDTVGASAIDGAEKEYGKSGTQQLLSWRKASHWTNFVTRMTEMIKEHTVRYPPPLHPKLKFYLAADSQEAYDGLSRRFGDTVIFTRRECAAERCDFRDCDSMIFSLVDMLNLARTQLILGSGYSSYSEVASRMGGSWGRGLTIQMAGRDFGDEILPPVETRKPKPKWKRAAKKRNNFFG